MSPPKDDGNSLIWQVKRPTKLERAKSLKNQLEKLLTAEKQKEQREKETSEQEENEGPALVETGDGPPPPQVKKKQSQVSGYPPAKRANEGKQCRADFIDMLQKSKADSIDQVFDKDTVRLIF